MLISTSTTPILNILKQRFPINGSVYRLTNINNINEEQNLNNSNTIRSNILHNIAGKYSQKVAKYIHRQLHNKKLAIVKIKE